MADSTNPYESPEVEGPAEAGAKSPLGRKLWRGAVAVLILAACVALSALGRLVAGGFGLAMLRQQTGPVGIDGRPLLGEEFSEGQFNWDLERAAFNLISGLVFAVFALVLLRYALQLRFAADGTISLEATLSAQNACWYLAAALVIIYFARVLHLPIVSLG